MKRVINTFLRTGYSTTKKFTTADLPYFLKPIAKDCNEGGIASNGNPFWSPENNGNRMKLIHAMLGYSNDIRKGTTFKIINEYENGDAYGIVKGLRL